MQQDTEFFYMGLRKCPSKHHAGLLSAVVLLLTVLISTPPTAFSSSVLSAEETETSQNQTIEASGNGYCAGGEMKILDKKMPEDDSREEKNSSTSLSLAGGGLFADYYFGGAIPGDGDQHIRSSAFGVVARSIEKNVNYDTSITLGFRLGYWFKSRLWLGTAMDVSYFQVDSERKDISVYPVSGLLLLRMPNYRFQPYIGIGPALFISKMRFSVDLSPLSSGDTGYFEDTSCDLGLDTRAGFAMDIDKNTAIFAEYRLTRYSAKYTDCISDVKVDLDMNTHTHHIFIGISYRL